MPKQKQDEAPDGLVEVRALVDLPAYGADAGRLARVPAGLVPEMRASVMVDDDPAAIAAAKAEG